MKTVQQLKRQIYNDVESSGYLRNVQADVKAHVLNIIEQESNNNKQKLGFQYEHPVLKKLKAYPLTSLCMDLIQEFLESFKFKHTLSVFKKEINRETQMNRANIYQKFNLEFSKKDQAVLLSIVGCVVNQNIKFVEKPEIKTNNFMNNQSRSNQGSFQRSKNDSYDSYTEKRGGAPQKNKNQTGTSATVTKQKQNQKFVEDLKKQNLRKETEEKQRLKKQKEKQQEQAKRLKQIQIQKQIEKQKQLEKQKQAQALHQKNQNTKGKRHKQEKPKAPEDAKSLISDIVSKFQTKKIEAPSAKDEFEQRKTFSQQKAPKKVVAQQSGQNKIRGISMGKMGAGAISNSFMKFASGFNTQPTKNQDEQQFEQSKDSLRRNPLNSSNESGFDKSYGYDESVDSNAIYNYEYPEKAKTFKKK